MTTSLSGSSGFHGPAGASVGQRMTGGGNIIPKGYNRGQLQQFTPEQMQLFQQMFSQVAPESFLSKLAGGDQSAFGQLEAPAMRQFQELQGNIASRFSQPSGGPRGYGALGARHGSGFQNQLNAATSNFAQDLQAQRLGLQRRALMDLMGISESLLEQKPYNQFFYKPEKKPSFWQSLLGGASPIIGAGLGGFFGGPAGAKLGGQLGGSFGQAFF